MAAIETPRHGLDFGALVPFFAITFALGWGIIALLIFLPEQTEAVFGPMGYTNPLFILAVYSPAIAASWSGEAAASRASEASFADSNCGGCPSSGGPYW